MFDVFKQLFLSFQGPLGPGELPGTHIKYVSHTNSSIMGPRLKIAARLIQRQNCCRTLFRKLALFSFITIICCFISTKIINYALLIITIISNSKYKKTVNKKKLEDGRLRVRRPHLLLWLALVGSGGAVAAMIRPIKLLI